MKLQEQRSIFITNKCCPLINRCKRILFPAPTAPAREIRLLLRLLLLLSTLQKPTQSSEDAMKINFDLAPGSFDDQYHGCSKQVMEKLDQGDYFTEDLQAHKNYSRIWHKTHLTWMNQPQALPKNMTIPHAVALLVYTLNSDVRSDFSKALANDAKTPQQYEHSFRFKYLHYYLTTAIQLLRKKVTRENDPLCYKVYHKARGVHFKAYVGATMRFGQFLSTSLLKEEAQKFENQTLFTIFTCLGASVQDFSLKKEVLIPPYELFKVVNMSYHPQGNWLQLQSTGNLSTYNCQLLKASNQKCTPAPIAITSVTFLTTIIISFINRV
ncbi:ecto-ADP-ribosyltransferase 4 [Nycticebus coucang]|uniref:ecto-ADP-ribosyltransferase 4 n=1 Tax=Nycticebus coucang TaxID=9470 RepID=UPI00234E32A1|nr:ecto-ADP-ribosyltransferase 4 [Nycticebus coucang]